MQDAWTQQSSSRAPPSCNKSRSSLRARAHLLPQRSNVTLRSPFRIQDRRLPHSGQLLPSAMRSDLQSLLQAVFKRGRSTRSMQGLEAPSPSRVRGRYLGSRKSAPEEPSHCRDRGGTNNCATALPLRRMGIFDARARDVGVWGGVVLSKRA